MYFTELEVEYTITTRQGEMLVHSRFTARDLEDARDVLNKRCKQYVTTHKHHATWTIYDGSGEWLERGRAEPEQAAMQTAVKE